MVVYIDGKWVDQKKAVMPISDLSITRAVALFESIRVYGSKPFKLDQHLDRIINSAKVAGFVNAPQKYEIEEIIEEGINRNYEQVDLVVKILLTAGSGDIKNFGASRLAVLFADIPTSERDAENYGIKLQSFDGPRFLSDHKHTDYFMASIGVQSALKAGFDDILYCDDKRIYESSTGNIFAIKDGAIITPRSQILKGITRDTILREIAPNLELKTIEKDISYDGLIKSEEVFITGSIREVVGISWIDKHQITSGVGEVTDKIHRAYRRAALGS